jgi:hypothetical protein
MKAAKHQTILLVAMLGFGVAVGVIISTFLLLKTASQYEASAMIALFQVCGVCAAGLLTLVGVAITVWSNGERQRVDAQNARDMERDRREADLRQQIYIEAAECASRCVAGFALFWKMDFDSVAFGAAQQALRASQHKVLICGGKGVVNAVWNFQKSVAGAVVELMDLRSKYDYWWFKSGPHPVDATSVFYEGEREVRFRPLVDSLQKHLPLLARSLLELMAQFRIEVRELHGKPDSENWFADEGRQHLIDVDKIVQPGFASTVMESTFKCTTVTGNSTLSVPASGNSTYFIPAVLHPQYVTRNPPAGQD